MAQEPRMREEQSRATRTDLPDTDRSWEHDGTGLSTFLASLPAFKTVIFGRTTSSLLLGQLAALILTAIAFAVRYVVDPYLPPGFPYLTFFPAVILAGFIFGIYAGVTSAVLSGMLAWYWFIAPVQSFELTPQSLTALLFYLAVVVIDLGLLQLLLTAYASQVRARRELLAHLAMQDVVSREVDHRIKNLLATIIGLLSISQKYASTPKELAEQLRSRIGSMGLSIALIRGSGNRESADLRETIEAVLGALGLADGNRLTLTGPQLSLNGPAIIALNLVIHELGTNAIKYGSLQRDGGSINLRWGGSDPSEGQDLVWLEWEERDGPVVSEPTVKGFGTDLVTRMAASLGGGSQFAYRPEGLKVRIDMSRDRVLA